MPGCIRVGMDRAIVYLPVDQIFPKMGAHIRGSVPVIRSPITVSIPSELKQQALDLGVPFSATLEEALVARIDNLMRAELGGKLASGHQPENRKVINFESRT